MIVGSLIVSTSCVRQQTVADIEPVRNSLQVQPRDSALTHMSFTTMFNSGRLTYDYRSTAVIQVLNDSIPRTDSVHITALLAMTFEELLPKRSIRVTNRIDSLFVQPLAPNAQASAASSRVAERWPAEDQNLEIDRTSGRVTRRLVATVCNQDNRESPLRGDEVIPVVPSQAGSRRSWADTSTRQLCRGGVLLDVTQIARYDLQVSPDSGDSQLIRFIESQLAGSGTQWQQPVKASGHIVATDTFFIARTENRIQRVVGSSRSEISFQAARRNQQFSQITSTEIQLRK